MQCKRFIRTTASQLVKSKPVPDAILALPPYTLPPASALRLTLYASDVNEFMKRVLDAKEAASAFDMEWNMRRGPQRRVGLIQVAHPEAGLLLYSVPRGETDRLPSSLKQYLESPAHIKMGVHITGDTGKLNRDWPDEEFSFAGLLELSDVARRIDPERWQSQQGRIISLQNLVAHYLERHLSKGEERTNSNWESKYMPPKVLQYAAGDVLSTVDLYNVLYKKLLACDADAKLEDYLRAYNASGSLIGGLPPAVRQSVSFTPKQVEAWSRVFPRSDTESDEWSWDIEAAAKQMDIKSSSVLNHLLDALLRVPASAKGLTPEQMKALEAAWRKDPFAYKKYKTPMLALQQLEDPIEA